MLLPKFEIDEIIARYALEPTLQDVFVEGIFDKELMTQWSGRRDDHCVYYDINCVNVPNYAVARLGLTSGNKQRVIALATELSACGGTDRCAYRCIVDSDLDHWLCRVRDVPNLRWTKPASLEGYFAESAIVRDLLVSVAKIRVPDWNNFFASFQWCLSTIFAYRLADSELAMALDWIDFTRYLTVGECDVGFDCDKYVSNLMNKNHRKPNKAEFISCANAWCVKISGAHACGECVNGHDFLNLMAWCVKAFRGVKGYANSSVLQRALLLECGAAVGLELLVM